MLSDLPPELIILISEYCKGGRIRSLRLTHSAFRMLTPKLYCDIKCYIPLNEPYMYIRIKPQYRAESVLKIHESNSTQIAHVPRIDNPKYTIVDANTTNLNYECIKYSAIIKGKNGNYMRDWSKTYSTVVNCGYLFSPIAYQSIHLCNIEVSNAKSEIKKIMGLIIMQITLWFALLLAIKIIDF